MPRMFVAVIPPPGVVEDLEDFLAPRRDAHRSDDRAARGSGRDRREPPLRWTLTEHWHLTLAFAADVPDRAHDDLVARLERAARKRAPMPAQIVGGGAFPDPARARVLYAGVETDTVGMSHLATGARAAMAKAGAEVEGGKFHAHLTLARVSRPIEATRWIRVLDAYRGPRWQVGEIALVASHLGEGPRNRPRYEVVETFTLGRSGSAPAPPDAPVRGR